MMRFFRAPLSGMTLHALFIDDDGVASRLFGKLASRRADFVYEMMSSRRTASAQGSASLPCAPVKCHRPCQYYRRRSRHQRALRPNIFRGGRRRKYFIAGGMSDEINQASAYDKEAPSL